MTIAACRLVFARTDGRTDGRTDSHTLILSCGSRLKTLCEKPDRRIDRWTGQPPYNQVSLDKDMPERHVVHPYLPLSAHFPQDKTQNALAIKMALSHY